MGKFSGKPVTPLYLKSSMPKVIIYEVRQLLWWWDITGSATANRRWRLVAAQLFNKFGFCSSCNISIVLAFHKYNLRLVQMQAFISCWLLRSYWRAPWILVQLLTQVWASAFVKTKLYFSLWKNLAYRWFNNSHLRPSLKWEPRSYSCPCTGPSSRGSTSRSRTRCRRQGRCLCGTGSGPGNPGSGAAPTWKSRRHFDRQMFKSGCLGRLILTVAQCDQIKIAKCL